MNNIVDSAIILHRINYGESDKIITVITPDHGKVTLMARGVRKVKSKLAGGIELFSVSTITFILGKKDISTLISTRLKTHFHHIVEDLDRTSPGYEILRMFHTSTQDSCDADYYRLLLQTLTFLNDKQITPILTKTWFMARLLVLLGRFPNIEKPIGEEMFEGGHAYIFEESESSFALDSRGTYSFNHLKVLKLLRDETPQRISVISGVRETLSRIEVLLEGQVAKQ